MPPSSCCSSPIRPFSCSLSPSTTTGRTMGSGQSCQDRQGNPIALVCPSGGDAVTGGDAHLGSKTWNSETTSYVSIGLLNVYLSTQITSSGLFLGMFLGFLITISIWIGVNKRKQRIERKRKSKEKEKQKDVETAKTLEDSLAKLVFSPTGSHSSSWPAFRGSHGPSASAPQHPPTHSLVPVPWGQP